MPIRSMPICGRSAFNWGPAFRLIQRYWSGNREVLAELIDIEESGRTGETTFVSTPLLDACCQVIGVIGLANDVESLYLPTRYARFVLFAPLPTRLYCHALDRSDSNPGSDIREFNLTFLTHDGQVLGYLTGFQVRPRATNSFTASSTRR